MANPRTCEETIFDRQNRNILNGYEYCVRGRRETWALKQMVKRISA